jgi:hypothetical protein
MERSVISGRFSDLADGSGMTASGEASGSGVIMGPVEEGAHRARVRHPRWVGSMDKNSLPACGRHRRESDRCRYSVCGLASGVVLWSRCFQFL